MSEHELAKVFYEQQGVYMRRMILQSGSRTTRENALQVAALPPKATQIPPVMATSNSPT